MWSDASYEGLIFSLNYVLFLSLVCVWSDASYKGMIVSLYSVLFLSFVCGQMLVIKVQFFIQTLFCFESCLCC